MGNKIFIKSLGDSKGTKTNNVIHLLSCIFFPAMELPLNKIKKLLSQN